MREVSDRTAFLSRSHFQISQDAAATDPSLESVFKRDYPPLWIHGRLSAIDPPPPVQFHHLDDRFFKDELSETTQSYPAKCQPRVSFGDANKLRATNFKMEKDLSKFNEYNTTHDSQYTPHIISSKPKAVENHMKSSLQYGDQDKSENPISDYRDNFLGHDALLTKPKRAANKHLTEGSSTFLGDERLSHFETSSAEQFRGLRLPRITPFPRPVGTNVPKGDQDKEVALESTQTSSYVAQPRSCVPYDKSIVVENLRKTNFTLVDGLGTFDNYRSTATDSYNSKYQKDDIVRVSRERNHSDLPHGDEDPVRAAKRFNMTTNKFHFDDPITLPANILSGANLRTKSKVWFGDPSQGDRFYSTTTSSTFMPNDLKYEKLERSNLTVRSDIPVKYYGDEKTMTVMKSDYKNPCQVKLVPNAVAVSRIRDSHIQPPAHGIYFSTENQDQFTPKESQRVAIDSGKLQRSTVPLGALCAA